MPQETNLNVSPYFDDFDSTKDYYKVLFKPGYPIQARELTGLQSILQNQIEQFGKHIFDNGSPVIGGEFLYTNPAFAVEVDSEFNGIPISIYLDSLVGKKLRGETSGVLAEVYLSLSNQDSERSNYTLYINYTASGGANYTNSSFFDAENLLIQEDFSVGNTVFLSGQPVLRTISSNSTSSSSIVTVNSGVFFVNGYFVYTDSQKLVLSQYGTTPTYKVGFNIRESFVNYVDDPSLVDNAKGFNNYTAPGADRLAIDLVLEKRDVTDVSTTNFIELLRVENGQPQYIVKQTQYSLIRDELAKRTFDESGNYFVRPFTVFARDTLNDKYRQFGIYTENQTTASGNTPSDNLLTYQIGPGKAYVNGYDVETISSKLIDVEKPRTTATLNDAVVPYNAGSLVIVKNVYGAPNIGLANTTPLSLMSDRIGETSYVAAGTTIGYARVYDFVPESQYQDDTSNMELRLFDIQTFTQITLTEQLTSLSASSRIKGKRSNASGFVKDSVTNSKTVTLYSVSGAFIENEQIEIDGIDDGRLISTITNYEIEDVKSVYSKIGISTFNADIDLSNRISIAPLGTQFRISGLSGGISTVTTGTLNTFVNVLKSGDIITYANPNLTGDPIYNKVVSVSAAGTSFTISGITTVANICDGGISTTSVTVNNIIKLTTEIDNTESYLLSTLPEQNIASISLDNNEILQRRYFSSVSVSSNSLQITITEPDLFFADFDEDNYVISYTDGTLETLRSDKYDLDGTGKVLTFNGLSKTTGTANVIATIRNIKPNPINKKLNTVSTLLINKSKYTQSGIGTTTLNDGLTYNQYYGIRVQDEEISLNVPDVLRVLAVYESNDSSDPVLPKLSLSSFSGLSNSTSDIIVGEIFEGSNSDSVGIVVSVVNSNIIEFTYLNNRQFTSGESITFKTSGITATISSKVLGSKNVRSNYNFDSGQRDSICDYSRIIRKIDVEEPKNKLKVVFQNYVSESNDTGEFISVNSYSRYSYNYDIPIIANKIRCSDLIDLRPRVSEFSSSNKSPFEFDGKSLNAVGKYSSYVLAPNKTLIMDCEYYLPRIDVVTLTPNGNFEIVQGIPAKIPTVPRINSNSIDIATVYLPPYTYNSNNAIIDMISHKRYRMSDISLLEDRIHNLEKTTTLSLLESKVENLTIKDAETGLDRFKTGFFADNFIDYNYTDQNNPQFKSFIYRNNGTLGPIPVAKYVNLQLGSEAISGFTETFDSSKDLSFVEDLGSPNVRKTGDLVTLDYSEVEYINQPYATTETPLGGIPSTYFGTVQLSPSEDIWYEEKMVERTTFVEGKTETVQQPSELNITKTVTVQGPDSIVYVDSPSYPDYSGGNSRSSPPPQGSTQLYGAINGTFQPFRSLDAYNDAARAAGVPIGERSSFTARETSPNANRYADSPSPGLGYGNWGK
jgi:hypothetical protein